MKSFIDSVTNWTDIDVAEHLLATHLGMVNEVTGSFQKEYKWIYMTDNKYGNSLQNMIMEMVALDFLQFDKGEMKVKANPDFKMPATS